MCAVSSVGRHGNFFYIATAKTVRTLGGGRVPSHRVDNLAWSSCVAYRLVIQDQHRSILLKSGEYAAHVQ